MGQNDKQGKDAALGCLGLIGAVLVVTFFVFITGVGEEQGPSVYEADREEDRRREELVILADGTEIDEHRALVMCENQVRDRLRAPSTADFVGRFNSAFIEPRKVGNVWRHTVIVDAENAFGAKIRSSFYCEIDGDESTILVEEQ